MQNRPLLLRLATHQVASGGQQSQYDEELDELLVREEGRWIPAIDSVSGSPATKKADVETGEDSKDRW